MAVENNSDKKNNFKIAVLSGKGGTGKTLVSVNLASVAALQSATENDDKKITYIDCDVEEPNGKLFFRPVELEEKEISVKIPQVNSELCTGCRKCVNFCKYNALASINKKLIIFEEVCHSCGGCVLLCPEKALSDREKIIGKVDKGISENVEVKTGTLNMGEASGVPIIQDLISDNKGDYTFIDCPPGSACIVMESIKDADYCVLVAEPTIFGEHNFNMVYELVKMFNKPFGAVLNKCMDDKGVKNPSEEFCKENKINVLGKIPFDKELGLINSNGEIAVRKNEKYKILFSDLLNNIKKEIEK